MMINYIFKKKQFGLARWNQLGTANKNKISDCGELHQNVNLVGWCIDQASREEC